MESTQVDFANILFAGPCNRHCPDCIGHALPAAFNRSNLDQYPPRNIEDFIKAANHLHISHIIFSATNTDPQLYCCERDLLTLLRQRIHTGADYALHTNGVLALQKMDVFQQYDKVTISLPSFNPRTYARLMGSPNVPDISRIVERSSIPVKLSMLLSEANVHEVPKYLQRCAELGIKRVVLRKRYGEKHEWEILEGIEPQSIYRNNPVYWINGVEVTYWVFETSSNTSLNLFADGTLGSTYLLAQTPNITASASCQTTTTKSSQA